MTNLSSFYHDFLVNDMVNNLNDMVNNLANVLNTVERF